MSLSPTALLRFHHAKVAHSARLADSSGFAVSIVSGSQASTLDGALSAGGPLSLLSSTVVQNYAPSCAGLHAQHDAQIDGSIVAGNFSIGPGCVDLAAAGTISGPHNLVGVDNGGLPQYTIVADPRLAPLADHGRFTRTHALLANSPAVNAGADTSEFITDPRGDGFARNSGSAVDIGAYKRQVNDDEIFFGSFGKSD